MLASKFGHWTVTGFSGLDPRNRRRWLVLCDCGISGVVREDALRSGRSLSCGAHRKQDLALRFWALVQKSTGCWEWLGTLQDGYGVFYLTTTKRIRASRMAWELVVGPIPPGLGALHTCDNPKCVRIESETSGHIFLGTNAQNQADKLMKGRQARGERNGGAKLTEAEVTAIRALLGHKSYRAIAQDFGICASSVGNIATGRLWARKPPPVDPKSP